jgi:DNA-binding LacI/PurR family transcriptional regulator
MAELQAEGRLARTPGAGSFLPGPTHELRGVVLVFHPRAKRAGSFGAQLLRAVRDGLGQAGIACRVAYAEASYAWPEDQLPVFWECPEQVAVAGQRRHFAVLLNDRPPAGLGATVMDGISVDDYSGGAAAAQILAARGGRRAKFAVLAGPALDPRSGQRVQGFLDHAPKTEVVAAGTWFAEEASAAARRIARGAYEAVFCCNDGLAAALLTACRELGVPRPAVVGFDDAPVAEELDLTTIAIPWERFAEGIVEVARRRLAGDAATASQRIFAPHPVMRRSHLAP